ncbi:HD domain-containing phosphohydrolase [Undibacterium sp. SXout11W]|uniref:HD domain-containing phosphohydrolase n=1 Tax=Undibacterium sp. SXout11W TaxID=3413050 RepID=UPI003BF2E183
MNARDESVTRNDSGIYASAWQHSSFPLIAINRNTDVVLDVNHAVEEMTGYSPVELIGKSYFLLHFPEEQSAIANAIEQFSGPTVLKNVHIQHKDRHAIPIEISFACSLEVQDVMILIISFRDLKHVSQSEFELQVKKWELAAYASAVMALSKAKSREDLMQAVCDALTHEHRYTLASVGIAEDTDEKDVRIAAASGRSKAYIDDLKISWSENSPHGRGPTGIAIRTGIIQVLNDVEMHTNFKPWGEKARLAGIRSSATIPFVFEQNRHGALMVYSSDASTFGPALIELFERLADEIAHGLNFFSHFDLIENERRKCKVAELNLSNALLETIKAMAKTMENRDPYTAGHQDRVSIIACAIGQQLGLSEAQLKSIQMAALVHDIGKIAVPIEILTKPKSLNDAEFSLIKEHPLTGYNILKDVPFPWPVAEIVYQHHEKIDGSGYPRGLRGDQILLEARVLAVADIVEAMASYRPYRPALGIDIALNEIQKQSGKQLDAEIVAVCVKMFMQGYFSLPTPQQHHD